MSLICDDIERVVRAITTAHFDREKGRYSSDLMKGLNISVSRLAVLPLEHLWPIFIRDLDKPPRIVSAAGELEVGAIKRTAMTHDQRTMLDVHADPTPTNAAHAEIRPSISRGLAKKLIDLMVFHARPEP